MPNHYDVDIWCQSCGKYIKTIYTNNSTTITSGDRLCESCKKKGLKPNKLNQIFGSSTSRRIKIVKKQIELVDKMIDALRKRREELVGVLDRLTSDK